MINIGLPFIFRSVLAWVTNYIVTLVSGFYDDLGQGRDLDWVFGRCQEELFRFHECQTPGQGGRGCPYKAGVDPQVVARIWAGWHGQGVKEPWKRGAGT
jgi:hypothetical protein